jgi:hypothetical protein
MLPIERVPLRLVLSRKEGELMEKRFRSVALLSAGLLVGGAAAGALVVSAANAATAGPSLTAASASAGSTEGERAGGSGDGRRFSPYQGSKPVRGDEKAVSSAIEAKLKAAALKAVPGGTVLRVETDAGDAAYEAHMTKSDGSFVTVKFDTSYAVTAVEDGMGKGDPRSDGRHGGPEGQRSSNGGTESPSTGT